MKKIRIGIFGSSAGETVDTAAKARGLGRALAGKDVILITGACSGLPYAVVFEANKQKKMEIWGYSPAYEFGEQCELTPKDDNSIYTKILYTPREFPIADIAVRRKYRNVLSTAACDAGIIVSGRWGSLNEFTNLFDMGKVIGIYTGTGGVADELEVWNKKISKPSKAVVIYDSSSQKLVERVVSEVRKRRNT